MAVWLKTHWISRLMGHHVLQRADRPVEPEVDPGDRRGTEKLVDSREGRPHPGSPVVGDESANPIEGDGQDQEVGGDLPRRSGGSPPSGPSGAMVRTPVVSRTSIPCSSEPGFEPGAVESAQRDQGDLHLESVAVAEKPVEEHLAGVAHVHLVEPLVQGRDEDGRPVAVLSSGPSARAMEQPVGKRLARPSWPGPVAIRSRARP